MPAAGLPLTIGAKDGSWRQLRASGMGNITNITGLVSSRQALQAGRGAGTVQRMPRAGARVNP